MLNKIFSDRCRQFMILIILVIIFSVVLLSGCDTRYNQHKNISKVNDMVNIFGNIYNYGWMAEGDNSIYYIDWDNNNPNLYKSNLDGKNKKNISNGISSYINVIDGWIYYISSDDKIYKMDTNGQNKQKISDDKSRELIAFGKRLYYVNLDKKGIFVMNVDGSSAMSIYNGSIKNILFYNKHIYYINQDDNYNLCRIDMKGNNKEKIISSIVSKFLIYNENIYYLDDQNDLCKTNILGQDKIKITNFAHIFPESMNIYNNTLFYCTSYYSKGKDKDGIALHSFNLDKNVDKIINLGIYEPIYIICGEIFYCDSSQWYHMDLNGNNKREF